jgi:hypothetical protein
VRGGDRSTWSYAGHPTSEAFAVQRALVICFTVVQLAACMASEPSPTPEVPSGGSGHEAADSPRGGDGPVCPTAANSWGWYCGGGNLHAGDPTHLYYCPKTRRPNGASIDLGACPAGPCNVVNDPRKPDFCTGGASNKDVSGVTLPAQDGFYCGGPGSHLGSGQADHLYFFKDSLPADLGRCPNGCFPGAPDHCGAPIAPRACSFYGTSGPAIRGGQDSLDATQAAQLRSVGAGSIRLAFHLDAGSTVWDDVLLSHYDELVTRAIGDGLEVVGVIDSGSTAAPQSAWNAPPGTDGTNAFVQTFLDITSILLGRYGDRISSWEIWSQPNRCARDPLSACEANPSAGLTYIRPEVYSQILAGTFRQNHDLIVQRGIHLIAGGLYSHGSSAASSPGTDYLDEVYRQPVWNVLVGQVHRRYPWDQLGLAVYTNPGPAGPLTEIGGYLDALAGLRARYHDHAQVVVTELGWPTQGNPSVDEATQANNLDTALRILELRPEVERVFLAALSDATSPGWGIFSSAGAGKLAAEVLRRHSAVCIPDRAAQDGGVADVIASTPDAAVGTDRSADLPTLTDRCAVNPPPGTACPAFCLYGYQVQGGHATCDCCELPQACDTQGGPACPDGQHCFLDRSVWNQPGFSSTCDGHGQDLCCVRDRPVPSPGVAPLPPGSCTTRAPDGAGDPPCGYQDCLAGYAVIDGKTACGVCCPSVTTCGPGGTCPSGWRCVDQPHCTGNCPTVCLVDTNARLPNPTCSATGPAGCPQVCRTGYHVVNGQSTCSCCDYPDYAACGGVAQATCPAGMRCSDWYDFCDPAQGDLYCPGICWLDE